MSVRLINGAEFLHIPKTGGSWVTAILNSQNLTSEYYGHKHADYDHNLFQNQLGIRHHLSKVVEHVNHRLRIKKSLVEHAPFRFCFVRHPINWYESYWRFMEDNNWHGWGKVNSAANWHPTAILEEFGSPDFNEFMFNVIRNRPGYVSELYFSYTKPGISFIGKNENLREDLAKVLNKMKLTFDKTKVLGSQRVNKSRTPREEINWDPQLKNTILKLELPALIHFGYLTEEEQRELAISPYIPPNVAMSNSIRENNNCQ